MTAFRNIYEKGGAGAFWRGWQPKMVESFLKGGILLFSKDAVIRSMTAAGASDVTAGLVGGFAGGCSQVIVMGPCTFLVTAAVTGDKSVSLFQRSADVLRTRGIGGFYQGGTALLLRQGIVGELHVCDNVLFCDVRISYRKQLGVETRTYRHCSRGLEETPRPIGRVHSKCTSACSFVAHLPLWIPTYD